MSKPTQLLLSKLREACKLPNAVLCTDNVVNIVLILTKCKIYYNIILLLTLLISDEEKVLLFFLIVLYLDFFHSRSVIGFLILK